MEILGEIMMMDGDMVHTLLDLLIAIQSQKNESVYK